MKPLTVFIYALAITGCSDNPPIPSACPQTSGMTWQELRTLEAQLSGTPCVGDVTCYFAGCALPGDRCSCDKGKWVCGHTECYPPDRGIEAAVAKDLRGDQSPKRDQPKGDARGSFACGALLLCKTASEYCERTTPGACGGPELSDGGTCPPNCSPTTCGSGKPVCLCQSYSCKALPTGCTSCACVGATGGCTCTQGNGGELNVHCALP